MKTKSVKVAFIATLVLVILNMTFLGAILGAGPGDTHAAPAKIIGHVDKQGDQELAYLLVKLVLRTRAVVAGHYGRSQSSLPGVDLLYKRSLAKNLILPAAVADGVFAEVVPHATGGRAWVKMVVAEPRNPNNRGDATALAMLDEIKDGAAFAERIAPDAYYYGEPIKANAKCMPCHGNPAGASDPLFPQFEKDGWRVGETVGAVIARVAAAN